MTMTTSYDPMVDYRFDGAIKRHPDGTEATLVKVKESVASNGVSKYFTLLWSDGMLSCDCRGWTILKKDHSGRRKERTCKHCKASRACDHDDMTAVAQFQARAPAEFQQQVLQRTAPAQQHAGIRIRNRN